MTAAPTFPTAVVLGDQLRPGDEIGTDNPIRILDVGNPIPGECQDRAAALAGRCRCSKSSTPITAMPRRYVTHLVGNKRMALVVLDHIRYRVWR